MKNINDWSDLLKPEMEKIYFRNLMKFINKEYITKSVLPAKEDIFKAFELTPYSEVKCVIVGQDPYPTKGDACGLAFSTKSGNIPRSLMNIFKELRDDIGCNIPETGDLTKWAKEGVLLLNSILTVIEGKRNSHANRGWETFTNKVLSLINNKQEPVVFMLWGNEAKKKKSIITNPIHLIIESSHPSPLSASNGFEGSKPFSRANEFLKKTRGPIDWDLNCEVPDTAIDITGLGFEVKLLQDKAFVITSNGTYLYSVKRNSEYIILTGEGLTTLKMLASK